MKTRITPEGLLDLIAWVVAGVHSVKCSECSEVVVQQDRTHMPVMCRRTHPLVCSEPIEIRCWDCKELIRFDELFCEKCGQPQSYTADKSRKLLSVVQRAAIVMDTYLRPGMKGTTPLILQEGDMESLMIRVKNFRETVLLIMTTLLERHPDRVGPYELSRVLKTRVIQEDDWPMEVRFLEHHCIAQVWLRSEPPVDELKADPKWLATVSSLLGISLDDFRRQQG